MNLKDVDLQGSLIAALSVLVVGLGGLLGLRAQSKVRAENGQESRQSRFEERRDQEHKELTFKVSQLQQALLSEREAVASLRRRLRDQSVALQNTLEALLEANPAEAKAIGRWVRESTFAAFDDKPAPKAPQFTRVRR
jgi:hypothetical protein